MGKALKVGFIGLIVVIVIGFVALTLSIDSIVKSSIEDIGSEMTGTLVSVDGVSISPFSGQGTISEFRVANPDGYSEPYAVEIGELFIEIDVMSVFSDVVIVRQISVLSPMIYVEQQLPQNNIQEILNHVNSVDAFEASDSEMMIEYFVLEDGRVELYTEVGGERSATVEIETIEMHDIGDGREAVENIIQQIADEVGERVLRAAIQSGGEQIRDALRGLFN